METTQYLGINNSEPRHPPFYILNISIEKHSYDSVIALKNCHLSVQAGSLIAVVGPNGGGKSTFLKIAAGLITPTCGRVNQSQIAPKDIAYLPQSSQIDRSFPLRAEDVVAMGLWSRAGIFKGIGKKDHLKIIQAMSLVGLEGFGNRSLLALSGGQLQRLFFARAITQESQLILLDEPFTGIDEPTIQDLMKIIQLWIAQRKTVIAVLHDVRLVRQFFPETILIAQKLIAYGKTEEVLTHHHLTQAAFNV